MASRLATLAAAAAERQIKELQESKLKLALEYNEAMTGTNRVLTTQLTRALSEISWWRKMQATVIVVGSASIAIFGIVALWKRRSALQAIRMQARPAIASSNS